jgi:hypothetical protein
VEARESHRHQSSIFPHGPQTVQAPVIRKDDIFQSLAVQGDVQLRKPFLNLGIDVVVRWKLPATEMFFSLPNTSKSEEA